MLQASDGLLRRLIRGCAALVAALGAVYGTWLAVFGGFDLRLFGQSLTSHEPFRPLLIATLSLAVFMLAGGDESVERAVYAGADRLPRLVSDRNCVVAAVTLTAVVLVVSVTHASKLAAGSDAYGYLSQADLWLDGGHLSVPTPWASEVPWPDGLWSFAPLGYTPGPTSSSFALAGYRPSYDGWSIVPTYSPGLPMLMAAAKWLGGQPWVFLVVPLTGALLTLATFGLGRRLGSPRLGLMAALLVSSSPTTINLELVSMSDVPVAAACALAWWAALGRTIRSAIGAGLSIGAAVLIRPNLLPIAGVLIVWAIWRAVQSAADRRLHVTRTVIVGAGLATGMLTTAAVYWLTYGSPFVSGYGDVSALFGVKNILPNLWNYGRWFLQEQTILGFVGVGALFVTSRRLWAGVQQRSVIVAFAASLLLLVGEFCYFSVFEEKSYLRFFLPAYPMIMSGVAAVGLVCARRSRPAALGVAAVVVLSVVLGIRDSRPWLDRWHSDWRFLQLLSFVRAETPENSVILAMQHSGSVRYHAGRVSLRWDFLGPGWLDRAVDWMAERGVRTYAVVDRWEVERIRRTFAGDARAAVFAAPPVLQIDNSLFFDLTTPPGRREPAVVDFGQPQSNRALPSLPQPVLTWRQ